MDIETIKFKPINDILKLLGVLYLNILTFLLLNVKSKTLKFLKVK